MSSNPRPSSARRLASNPWSRLMQPTVDQLDTYGLPSKGEIRLNDFNTQETYYRKIVDRYMDFCGRSTNVDELEKEFAAASINGRATDGERERATSSGTITSTGKLQKSQTPGSTSIPSEKQTDLHTILHAMRKLREAIVATARDDIFAQRAYVFIIRASILVRHLESYHPALLYLLRSIHPRTPLPASELHEFVGYHILDLVCRQHDFLAAYSTRLEYRYRDRRLDKVLNALVHDDWVIFWRMRRGVDGHQRALMEWAVKDLRMHALKCIGKTYFAAEKSFVEASASLDWKALVDTCNLGWELDGEKVTIRRPKTRK